MEGVALVTGSDGFIGRHLAARLNRMGIKVIDFDIKQGRDVYDMDLVYWTIRDFKPQYIFHLAAVSIVGDALKHPLKALCTNIGGTWNVLEAARMSGSVKRIIIASSDKAYGSSSQLPYKEDYPLKGEHPYDVSKSCADLIAQSYIKTYSLPVAITRCGNVYGPDDHNMTRLIPDTIFSALHGYKLFIRSNGQYVRDYIYIDDIVDAYIKLAESRETGAFNFSANEHISVVELVEKIYRLSGKKPNYSILDQAQHEIPEQYLSSDKARKLLWWKPQVSLDEGLERTIEWYKQST